MNWSHLTLGEKLTVIVGGVLAFSLGLAAGLSSAHFVIWGIGSAFLP